MFAQFRPIRAALAVALCAAVAPLPAMAHDPAVSPIASPVASADSDARAQTKICVGRTVSGAQEVTGSMLSRRQCKTRAQWEAQGVKFEKRDAKSDS